MVIPRCFSSGALSIWSKVTSRLAGSSGTCLARTFVMAAVRVVLPWSTWPMVPTLRCGLFLSNTPLDIRSLSLRYLGRDALGHLGVVVELHGEGGAALGLGAHGGCVPEHLGERHHRADDLPAAARVHTLDLASPCREVAHNVAHELFGYDDLDVHYWLQQDRDGSLEGLLGGHATRYLEGHLGGVDLVVGAVNQLHPDIHDRVASDDAVIQRVPYALVHARDVLPGDDAADNLIVEFVAALFVVLHVDDCVAVLAAAARLAHEAALDVLGPPAYGLPVGDLRLADVRVDAELAQEPVEDDLEVQLAHTGDDRLPRLLVAAHREGRVLLGEPLQSSAQLLLVGLGLRLDGLRDDRLGEDHLLEHDLLPLIRRDERVARAGVREPDGSHQLACVDLLALLPAVGVELQKPADALAPVLGRVHDVGAGPERAGVHPHVRQLADVRVGLDLEGERSQRAVLVGLEGDLLAVGGDANDRRPVERAGQIIYDAVEQRLDALVLERRPAEDGGHLDLERRIPYGRPQIVRVYLLALEVHDH